MKQQLSIALTKLTFLGVILFIATSAQGQSLSTVVRVNIPFDFIVADKTFEAGEYSFNPVQDDARCVSDQRSRRSVQLSVFDSLSPETDTECQEHACVPPLR